MFVRTSRRVVQNEWCRDIAGNKPFFTVNVETTKVLLFCSISVFTDLFFYYSFYFSFIIMFTEAQECECNATVMGLIHTESMNYYLLIFSFL